MPVSIVADQGTHLLIADGDRYAVRTGSTTATTRSGPGYRRPTCQRSGQVLDDRDWTAQATAEGTFRDVVARGTQLARRML